MSLQLKDGYLYRVRSRNLYFGVYSAASNGFIGIREKFDSHYLDMEISRDSGGTALALEEIGPAPEELKLVQSDNSPLFRWLAEQEHENTKETSDILLYVIDKETPAREGHGWQFFIDGKLVGERSGSPTGPGIGLQDRTEFEKMKQAQAEGRLVAKRVYFIKKGKGLEATPPRQEIFVPPMR